jgi:hypothetical protein
MTRKWDGKVFMANKKGDSWHMSKATFSTPVNFAGQQVSQTVMNDKVGLQRLRPLQGTEYRLLKNETRSGIRTAPIPDITHWHAFMEPHDATLDMGHAGQMTILYMRKASHNAEQPDIGYLHRSSDSARMLSPEANGTVEGLREWLEYIVEQDQAYNELIEVGLGEFGFEMTPAPDGLAILVYYGLIAQDSDHACLSDDRQRTCYSDRLNEDIMNGMSNADVMRAAGFIISASPQGSCPGYLSITDGIHTRILEGCACSATFHAIREVTSAPNAQLQLWTDANARNVGYMLTSHEDGSQEVTLNNRDFEDMRAYLSSYSVRDKIERRLETFGWSYSSDDDLIANAFGIMICDANQALALLALNEQHRDTTGGLSVTESLTGKTRQALPGGFAAMVHLAESCEYRSASQSHASHAAKKHPNTKLGLDLVANER